MRYTKLVLSIWGLFLSSALFVACNNEKEVENLTGVIESSVETNSSSEEKDNSSSEEKDNSSEKIKTDKYSTVYKYKIGMEYIPDKFKKDKYLSRLSENRKAIEEVKTDYAKECAKLKKTGINGMNFENCVFNPMPDVSYVSTYYNYENHLSPEEAWEMIEYWAKKIGFYDQVDLDKEVVNASRQAVEEEIEKGATDASGRPLAKNDYNEMTGKWDEGCGSEFFFINDKYGYIQIGGSGVLILSFGKVWEYYSQKTGEELHKTLDPYHFSTFELIEQGSFDELKNKKYELFDGELSVEEAAEALYDYYDFVDEKVELEIYNVEIYKVIDKYIYRFGLRRKCEGIPMALLEPSQNLTGGDYSVSGESTNAVVCDSCGIDAFIGFRPTELFENIVGEQEKIIDILDASKIIEEKISSTYKCDIKQVSFSYLTYELAVNKASGNILVPAWQFEGENLIDGHSIMIYIDALTGEICNFEYY